MGTLNLEKNNLKKICDDDLSHLSSLSTLNLSSNQLSTESVRGLINCPTLCCLDLRNNGMQIHDRLIDAILSKLPQLRVLYLMSSQNEAMNNTLSDELSGHYRKS